MSAPALPAVFLTAPIAHRGLHDLAQQRPENSLAAFRAAIAAGYGIELDLQLSADGQAMVFHDYELDRLTGVSGLLRGLTAAQAGEIALSGGDGETIPTLQAVLELVAGQVPLLIELKDQDGAMGPDLGPLEEATARALAGYAGPVAVMSFNPHSVALLARLLPDLPRGLTTDAFAAQEWGLPDAVCDRLRDIPDYDRIGASFISHDWTDLARPRVAQLKAAGAQILSWTIKSPEQEAKARAVAVNVTFEAYLAAHPA